MTVDDNVGDRVDDTIDIKLDEIIMGDEFDCNTLREKIKRTILEEIEELWYYAAEEHMEYPLISLDDIRKLLGPSGGKNE